MAIPLQQLQLHAKLDECDYGVRLRLRVVCAAKAGCRGVNAQCQCTPDRRLRRLRLAQQRVEIDFLHSRNCGLLGHHVVSSLLLAHASAAQCTVPGAEQYSRTSFLPL